VAAEIRFPSHHPVAEGAMDCVTCHDPHADRRVSLGANEERCAGCHQDYMGPWLFEHPPVAEDCTTCHRPHGAVSDHLLDTPQPMLCLSCHTLADEFHHDPFASGILSNRTITEDDPMNPGEPVSELEARTYLRRCTDCHSAIHGSYTDEHLRH
jgi:DmsE family decaheme c-type cytochrome